MRYWTIVLMLELSIMITTSCNYHLRGSISRVATEMKTVILNSYDPYGLLTRAVRVELLSNNITLANSIQENQKNVPLLLYIINSSESQLSSSILRNGKTAEYQITLSVYAQVLISGKDYYPIDVIIHRSFFNNPLVALAKDTERDIIRQEMCQQAAQQLVRKMLIVYETTAAKTMNKAIYAKLKQQQPMQLMAATH